MSEQFPRFGEVLQKIRMEKGLGLRELARKIGVSGAYLSKIENGHFDPPAPDKIEALARELGIKADVLFVAARRLPFDVQEMIERNPEWATLVMRTAKDTPLDEFKKWLKEREQSKG
jgi:PTS system nitrogen regulatory IIA component